MSYSKRLKDYLISLEEEEKRALVSGFLRCSYGEEGFGSDQASLIRYIYLLLKEEGLEVRLINSSSPKRTRPYYLRLLKEKDLEELLVLEEGKPVERIPRLFYSRMKLQRAYLKGAFLAVGSMSDPKRAYHLEFKLDSKSLAQDLRDICLDFDLKAGLTRREKWLVYIKSSESLGDFLNLMGASSWAFKLSDLKIIREMKGDINRQVNFETANISRTVSASLRQVEAIKRIQNTIGIAALPFSLQEIALLRWEEQELSLKELGEALDPPLSKSGVNNRLARIVKIAEKLGD